jgi:antitoxin VapB
MTTKVFMNGRSQAVRIPKELRFEEEQVTIRRFGDGILIEPVRSSGWAEGWFEAIRIDDEAFVRPEQGELPAAVGLSGE